MCVLGRTAIREVSRCATPLPHGSEKRVSLQPPSPSLHTHPPTHTKPSHPMALPYTQCDLATLAFGEVDAKTGKKFVGTSRLVFQLNRDKDDLRGCPFGLSTPLGGEGEQDRRPLELEVDAPLAAFAAALDAKVAAAAVANAAAWFGKPLDEAAVRSMHLPLFQAGGETYAPKLRCKVQLAGKAPTRVWVVDEGLCGNSYARGTIDALGKGDRVMAVVKLSSVWVQPRAFGVSLTVDDLMVFKSSLSSNRPPFSGLGDMTRLV